MLEVKAYAKVNLSLDIVGRREDGYHLVRMVMQSLDIADILTFEKLDKPEIMVLLDNPSVGSDGDSPLGKVPLDENNLIYKAARLLFDRYIWKRNEKAGVQITLTKNIPIAAGMAGGSSDAAATFRGINELFELGLMDKELMEMGVTLGADIPYCIMGGTALSEGIGEERGGGEDGKMDHRDPCFYLDHISGSLSYLDREQFDGNRSLCRACVRNCNRGRMYLVRGAVLQGVQVCSSSRALDQD